MSKQLLIGLLIAGIVAIGGAAFILTRDNGAGESTSTTNDESSSTDSFNPLATNAESFEAKLTGTAEGKQYSATILHDGKGNTKYTSNAEGETIEFYVSGSTFISCQDNSCVRFPEAELDSALDQSQYSYSEEDFAQFRDTAKYLGKQSCPAGTCDVWEVEDGDTDYTTKVFLAGDRRISKLTSSGEGAEFEITYEYKNVTVDIPEDVQSFPNL